MVPISIGPAVRHDGASPALMAHLLRALCDESDALKSGNPARLASAQSRKRHLLNLVRPWRVDGRRNGV